MRIKKLTNGSALKPGQLLVVLHCLNQCGSEALFDLRESIRIGVVQFYRHRREPVPWIGRSGNGRLFRRPRTTNERRAHYSNDIAEHSERPEAASTAESTALPSGIGEIRRALPLPGPPVNTGEVKLEFVNVE
jgi:hypothetical protein